MFIITGEFQAKPECVEEIKAMAAELIPLSQGEAGCISYAFYEDQSQAGRFLFFERWQSRDGISEHFEKSYFKEFVRRFPAMIIGEAAIEIHEITSTEKV